MNSLRRFSVRKFRPINSIISSNYIRKQYLCSAKDANSENERTAHFGFQTVRESEKADKGLLKLSTTIRINDVHMNIYCWFILLVHKVFEDVAASYDLMNDAMSMGVHRIWKDIFIERLGPTHGTKLLDMAGGTGDIAFRYIKYLQNAPSNPDAKKSHVTVSDINQNMLDVGKQRAKQLKYTSETLDNCTIDWVCANAEQLPFDDNTFNAYTIAFGIRNCTHIDKVNWTFNYIIQLCNWIHLNDDDRS